MADASRGAGAAAEPAAAVADRGGAASDTDMPPGYDDCVRVPPPRKFGPPAPTAPAAVVPEVPPAVDFAHVYEPSDDTYLLLDALVADAPALAALRPALAVEIGPGSGVVSTFLCQLFGRDCSPFVLACDINTRACDATLATARANHAVRLDAITCNLLVGMRQRLRGNVDVLLFNPPYVPTPSEEVGSKGIEAAWAGGEDGREVIDKVMPLVPDLMSPAGVMYMVVVEENKPDELRATMATAGFESSVVNARKAFNERLSILRFQRRAAPPPSRGGGDATPVEGSHGGGASSGTGD